MKRIYLYGVTGARRAYKVVGYQFIDGRNLFHNTALIEHIKDTAQKMQEKNPSIERVYAIDGRAGLAEEFRSSIRSCSIAGFYEFLDILEREGIRVI